MLTCEFMHLRLVSQQKWQNDFSDLKKQRRCLLLRILIRKFAVVFMAEHFSHFGLSSSRFSPWNCSRCFSHHFLRLFYDTVTDFTEMGFSRRLLFLFSNLIFILLLQLRYPLHQCFVFFSFYRMFHCLVFYHSIYRSWTWK